MKLAVISLKGKSSEMIARAASKYFEKVSSFDLRNVRVEVNKEALVMHESKNLADYDCIYLRGSYKYSDLISSIVIALQDRLYMPIHADSFLFAHNKFLTQVKLKEEKIPFPTTHLVHKTDMAKELANSLQYPVVFKLLSGTHGKGVMFAESREGASSLIDMLSKIKEAYMIQEYIETDATDLRALVLGKNVIAMKRVAKKGELRAGIHSGGRGQKIDLSYEDKQLAKRVARALGADICGVDMLAGATKTVITEVNLSPGIIGLTESTKLDVADKIAEFLYKKTEEFQKKQKEGKDIIDLNDLTGGEKGESISKLVVKAGRIILPSTVTEIAGFQADEEVKLKVDKDKIEIKKIKKVKVKK